MIRILAASVLVSMAGLVVGSAPATATPLRCEQRSAAHLAEHGGKVSDDAYHLSHGELPNCDNHTDSDDGRRRTDGDTDRLRIPHRDHFGWSWWEQLLR